MTRGGSTLEPREVREQPHAELVALLRVELRAVDVAASIAAVNTSVQA